MSKNLDNVFLPSRSTSKRDSEGELCGKSFGATRFVDADEVCARCNAWCNIGAHMCGACGDLYCSQCIVVRQDFNKLADVFYDKYDWAKHVDWQSLCIACSIPFEIAFDDE